MKKHKKELLGKKHYWEHLDWVEEHVNHFFEDSSISVFREIPVNDLYLDVFLIKPENASFNILLTSGMSIFKMNVDGVDSPKEKEFAELMILIPKTIEFEQVYTGENKNDWIITILKRTAKFPHFYNTWIGVGHTIQAEEELKPYSKDTEFVGAILLPSVTLDKRFTEIKKNGRKINIYNVFPLYANELEFKIEKGYHELLNLLVKANCPEVLAPQRKNLLLRKSFWSRIMGR